MAPIHMEMFWGVGAILAFVGVSESVGGRSAVQKEIQRIPVPSSFLLEESLWVM